MDLTGRAEYLKYSRLLRLQGVADEGLHRRTQRFLRTGIARDLRPSDGRQAGLGSDVETVRRAIRNGAGGPCARVDDAIERGMEANLFRRCRYDLRKA